MPSLFSCKRRNFFRSFPLWSLLATSFSLGELPESSPEKCTTEKTPVKSPSTVRNSRDYLPKVLLIRPHHFLDIIRSFCAGVVFKPSPAGHANHIVAQWLNENHDITLELTLGVDEICKPCSKLVSGRCTDIIRNQGREISKQEFNDLTDSRLFGELGLEPGVRINAGDFCRLALERLGDNYLLYPEFEREKPARHAENLNRGLKQYIEAKD